MSLLTRLEKLEATDGPIRYFSVYSDAESAACARWLDKQPDTGELHLIVQTGLPCPGYCADDATPPPWFFGKEADND